MSVNGITKGLGRKTFSTIVLACQRSSHVKENQSCTLKPRLYKSAVAVAAPRCVLLSEAVASTLLIGMDFTKVLCVVEIQPCSHSEVLEYVAYINQVKLCTLPLNTGYFCYI